MIHSHVKIWVHAIWATKNRQRVLSENIAPLIFKHLINESENRGIHTERINVQPEHVHYLFELPADRSLASVLHDIKKECSSWINKQKFLRGHFNWQRGYGAYSVSASLLGKVKKYIETREQHHKRVSFADENE